MLVVEETAAVALGVVRVVMVVSLQVMADMEAL